MLRTWSPATKTLVILTLLMLLGWLMGLLAPVLGALIIAALVAFILDPIVRWLIVRTRLSRPWAASLVYALLILMLTSIPAVLSTVVINRFRRLEIEFNDAITALKRLIAQPIDLLGFRLYPQVILDNLEQISSDALVTLPKLSLDLLSGVTTNLLWLFIVMISLYYFLKDGPKIKAWLIEVAPINYRGDFSQLLAELEEAWGTFLRVQLLISIVLAILISAGFLLVIWLFHSGLLAFSPLALILLLILVYTAAQQVDNLWLRPQLMGQQLHLHPGIVFAGLTGALMVSGVLGAFLVVPLMASVKILGRYVYCQLFDLPPWPEKSEEANEKQQQVGEEIGSAAPEFSDRI